MRAIDRDFAAVTPREAPLTLSYYLRLVAVRWWIPVSLALLCACLSLVYTGLQSTTYQSRATTLLSPLDPATADEFTRLTPTVARLLRSDSVLLDARQAYLNRSPDADPLRSGPDELRARTGVIVPRDTTLFEVTAQGPSQRDASALVGSVVEAAARRVSALGARPTTRTGATVPLRLDIFGPPVPEGKVSPTPTRNLVVGINVGLLLGIAGALLLRDPRRARMRADDLARLLDAADVPTRRCRRNDCSATGRHRQVFPRTPSERESGCSVRRCSKACSRTAASFFCSGISRRSGCAGLRSGSLRTWRTPGFVQRSSRRTTTGPGSGGSATGSANVCERARTRARPRMESKSTLLRRTATVPVDSPSTRGASSPTSPLSLSPAMRTGRSSGRLRRVTTSS